MVGSCNLINCETVPVFAPSAGTGEMDMPFAVAGTRVLQAVNGILLIFDGIVFHQMALFWQYSNIIVYKYSKTYIRLEKGDRCRHVRGRAWF